MLTAFLVAVGLGGLPQVTPLVQAEFTLPVTRVRDYPAEGEVVPQSALPMPPDTLEAYEQRFVTGADYFGAFALGKDGAYGFVTGTNSLDGARDIAIAECETHTDVCIIYAEIRPLGYVPLEPGEITMSAEAGALYWNPGDRPRYRAMALSEDGAYSMVWGHASQNAANAAAMEDCQGYRITDLQMRDMPCLLLPLK